MVESAFLLSPEIRENRIRAYLVYAIFGGENDFNGICVQLYTYDFGFETVCGAKSTKNNFLQLVGQLFFFI